MSGSASSAIAAARSVRRATTGSPEPSPNLSLVPAGVTIVRLPRLTILESARRRMRSRIEAILIFSSRAALRARPDRLRDGDVVFFQPVPKAAFVDSEQFGRAHLHAIGLLQRLDDETALEGRGDVVELNRKILGCVIAGFFADVCRQIGCRYHRSARPNHRAVDALLQFADIAGAAIGGESAHGVGAEADITLAERRRKGVCEKIEKQRDVLGPFAQRRKRDREHGEAVVKILAE